MVVLGTYLGDLALGAELHLGLNRLDDVAFNDRGGIPVS